MNREPESKEAGQPADYFLEIESHFAEKRGTPFVLSAKDWALMSEWFERGIPLPIVIEAIDSSFEAHAKGGRRRTISSLSYCRHAVRKLWDERRDLHVGEEGMALPEASIGERLAELADALAAAASPTEDAKVEEILRVTADRVRSIEVSTLPVVDDILIDIENALLDQLRSSLPAAVASTLESRVDSQLENIPFSNDEVRARTHAATFTREIRRHYAIPRLTLLS